MGPRGSEPGVHDRGDYGYGQKGYSRALPAEEQAKIEQQRTEFLKSTEKTRQQLYEKEQALQKELAKESPDPGKASRLQNEISKLYGILDQKRLDYTIKARKSLPDDYQRGHRGYGPMMRHGPCGGRHGMW
jgi:hypothetical protein